MLGRAEFYVAGLLFCLGLWGLLFKRNLVKKIISLNIMETSMYLFYIALGDVRFGAGTGTWAAANFVRDPGAATAGLEPMINPIPTGLILTAIVVSVCVTAFALSLIVRLHEKFGTLDIEKIRELSG